MNKETKFRVHYTRIDIFGDHVRGYRDLMAKTPDDAAAKVREEIPRVVILKTKVDKEK